MAGGGKTQVFFASDGFSAAAVIPSPLPADESGAGADIRADSVLPPDDAGLPAAGEPAAVPPSATPTTAATTSSTTISTPAFSFSPQAAAVGAAEAVPPPSPGRASSPMDLRRAATVASAAVQLQRRGAGPAGAKSKLAR